MKLDNLEVYERVYSSHWFLNSYHGIGLVSDFPKIGGGNYISQAIYVMKDSMCEFIFDKNEFEKSAQFTSNRLINDNKWRKEIYQKINYYTKNYFSAGEEFLKLDLSILSDKQIINVVHKIIKLQHYHQAYSVLVNGLILDGRNHLSNKIREELKAYLKNNKKFENYWSLLTQVTKMSFRQCKDLSIAQLSKKSFKLSKNQLDAALKKLHNKYCWLDYNNIGPETALVDFEQELRDANINKKHLVVKKDLLAIKKKQNKLMDRLKLTKRLRFLVSLSQTVIWQKGHRKDFQYHGFYCYEKLFTEIARRKKIIDAKLLFFLFPWEVENFIKLNQPSVNELKKRRTFSTLIITNSSREILLEEKAKKFVKKIDYIYKACSTSHSIKGQCAYIGKVRGRVKIIQTPDDIKKMSKGDILVSQATSPDILPAMMMASAIVTNTGGLICHAAITSREFKIPCIVGTGNATLVLRDGDFVEVDSGEGIVKKISSK